MFRFEPSARGAGRQWVSTATIVAGVLGLAPLASATPPPPAHPPEPTAPVTEPSHVSLGAEVGPGGVITSYNFNTGPSAVLVYGSVRAALDLTTRWAGELTLRQWWLPANHATMLGAGARFEPASYSFGRWFVDGTVGMATTNYAWSLAYDVGGGFEWDFVDVPGLGLGPYFRFSTVINPDPALSGDGRAWSLGASFTYRLGRAATSSPTVVRRGTGPYRITIPDTDGDGVADDEDECRLVKQGPHPDPYRPGCPEPDEDGDGIPDADDACPLAPPGPTPDPKRPGCPFADGDGDGISDADDACPNRAGSASADPTKNGCPAPRKRERGQVAEPNLPRTPRTGSEPPANPGPPPESDLAPKPVHKRSK